MSTSTPSRGVTPDDLLKMPDGNRYELADGQLIEDAASNESAWIATEIAGLLREYAKGGAGGPRGFAFGDGLQLRCFATDPDRVRKPDACYFSATRFKPEMLAHSFCSVAPELAVEVVSPSDVYYEVERKVFEYLNAGVLLVWVVSPESRTVVTYSAQQVIEHRTSSQILAGGDVLPGFECRIDSLFPSVDSGSR